MKTKIFTLFLFALICGSAMAQELTPRNSGI